MEQTTYCPNHPDTPTNLRCSRCEKLVCPRCMVHAPVGFRCLECGKGTRLPTYDVGGALLARAVLAGLLVGLAGGLIMALVARPFLFGLLYLAAMAGLGYLIAEAVSLSSNRKRGRELQYVAGGSVLLATAVIAFFGGFLDLFDLLGAGIAFYVAYVRLR